MKPGRNLVPSWVVSSAVAIALFSTWEIMAVNGLISPLLAPAPSEVAVTLVRELRGGAIGAHLVATLFRLAGGMLIGGTLGIIVGLAMGSSRRIREIADPFVSAIYPLPKIALFPVVMVLLGIGDASRIAIVTLSAFFPLMINTMNGVRQISPTHLDVARNYGAAGTKLFTRVVLPASLPMVLSGFRIALNWGSRSRSACWPRSSRCGPSDSPSTPCPSWASRWRSGS
jgi:NitT/TauT family transport system permease protein